jgi:hypothetical protein
MPESSQTRNRTLRRIFAFILAFGGLIGAAGSVLESIHLLRTGAASRAIGDGISLLLYAGSIYAGILLWKSAAPRSIALAFVSFLLQIPIISYKGVVYTFSTLLNVRLIFGDVNRHLLADLASSSNIYYSPGQTVWMFGINLVGVAGVCYLLWLARDKA